MADLDIDISGSLTRIMDEGDISSAELAKASGYSESTISRWKSGDRVPSLRAAKVIAWCLDVSVEDLCKPKVKRT